MTQKESLHLRWQGAKVFTHNPHQSLREAENPQAEGHRCRQLEVEPTFPEMVKAQGIQMGTSNMCYSTEHLAGIYHRLDTVALHVYFL